MKKVILAAAAISLLTACGSTVNLGASTPTSLADGGDGLGLGVATTPTPEATGTTESPVSVPTAEQSATTPADGGFDVGGGSSAPVLGVAKGAVTIGLSNVSNADAANQSLGVNFSTGNVKGEIDAVVAYINGAGGIAGRKLTPYFHPVDGGDQSKSTVQKSQEACVDYTQDHKVFAVLDSSPDENFLSCMAKSGVVVGGYEDSGYNATDFQRHPYFFDVNTLVGEKTYSQLPLVLKRQDWFASWDNRQGAPATVKTAPVIGILSVDFPQIESSTKNQLLPGLAKAGFPVKASNVVYLHNPSSQAGAAQVVAEIASAVLRFRSAGVTHVIITDSAGGVTYFFATAAESQGFRPRYGITTANQLQGFLTTKQISTRQVAGAMGLGYAPISDLPSSANPDLSGRYTNATRKLCLSIFTKAKITFPDDNSRLIALNYCDKLLFFRAVASRVKGALTRDAFRRETEALGSSFTPSALQKARFAPGHHWATTLGYDLRYESSCTCMRYYGQSFSLD